VQRYGFHCTCSACSLPRAESSRSDERLVAMSKLLQRLAIWKNGDLNGQEAIKIVREIWNLGEDEGYWSERGILAADAAWVAAAHMEFVF